VPSSVVIRGPSPNNTPILVMVETRDVEGNTISLELVDVLDDGQERIEHVRASRQPPRLHRWRKRNVSTTLIHRASAFRLDSVTAATGHWVRRIGRHGGVSAQA
jgi:hypothetical protein